MSLKRKVRKKGRKKTYPIWIPDEIPTYFSHIYNDRLSGIQHVFVDNRSILCQFGISKPLFVNNLHLLDYGALPWFARACDKEELTKGNERHERGVPRSKILHSRLKRLAWFSISSSIWSERSFPARSTVDAQTPIVYGGVVEGRGGCHKDRYVTNLPLSLFRWCKLSAVPRQQ